MKLVNESTLEKFLAKLKTYFATKDDLFDKANTSHTHDNRYYTESEMDTKLASKSTVGHMHSPEDVNAKPIDWLPTWDEIDYKPYTFPPTIGTTSTTAFRGDRGNIAYNHSTSEHAPIDAQRNADITKTEIELKLTGDVTTHSHNAQYYTEAEVDEKLLTKANDVHSHKLSDISDYSSDWATITNKPATFQPTLGTTSSTAFRGDYGLEAHSHSRSEHAPIDAQKNSDITKEEIESRLIGPVTTHSHDSQYYTESEIDVKLSNKSDLSHNHDGDYVTDEVLNNRLSSKANTIHGHNPVDIGARPDTWLPNWSEIDGKPSTFSPTLGTSSSTAFRGDYGNAAYAHSTSEHAPTDAQKNSDITKEEIEEKLTGPITTHNHNNTYYTKGEVSIALTNKSDLEHQHEQYVDITSLSNQLAGKANVKHSHTADEIGGDIVVSVVWDDVIGKPATFSPTLGTTSSTAHRGDHGSMAYIHSQTTHAPEDAQKNSDITKEEIEEKLVGNVVTHNHDSRYYTETEVNVKLDEKSDVGHTHEYVDKTSTGTITIHADVNASTETEAAVLRSGHNVLRVMSSGGGVEVKQNPSALTYNGNIVYHTGKKPTSAEIGARPDTWVPAWDDVTGKPTTFAPILGTTSSTAFRGDRGNVAYNHSQEAHAPIDAQKNSDITKEEIEEKLTGSITTHSHDGRYYTKAESNVKFDDKSDIGHTHPASDIVGLQLKIEELAPKTDLNTIYDSGTYTSGDDANSNSIVNRPPGTVGFIVEVYEVFGKGLAGRQIQTATLRDASMYIRQKSENTGWTSWSIIYNGMNKPSADDVSARPDTWVPAWSEVTNKPSTFPAILGSSSTTAFRGDYGNTAYAHSQEAHAPYNAQKNSDITKAEIEARLTGSITTHSHNTQYYTQAEVETLLSSKAESSHGNHVPAKQPANNAVFLRNDNTWSTVTAANIGAKSSTWVPAWSEVTDKPTTYPAALGNTSSTAFRGDYGNAAYIHSTSEHAPIDAQKNSDITKAEIEARLTGSVTTHDHDARYYTESEIDTKMNTKANTNHGNHVPAVETAKNNIFLRNDNSWQSVTANNIGAVNGSYITGTTAAVSKWYRIAQTTATDQGNTIGIFEIKTSATGKNSATVLNASVSFGSNPSIQQLSHSENGKGISKSRIVYHTTASGNRAYLEVFIPDGTARVIDVQLIGNTGWTLVTPSTAGAQPTGYSVKEITLLSDTIISNINGKINGCNITIENGEYYISDL